MLKETKILSADELLTDYSYASIEPYREHLTAKSLLITDEYGNKIFILEIFSDGKHCQKTISFLTEDKYAKENLLKEYLENYADKNINTISINVNANTFENQEIFANLGYKLIWNDNPNMCLYKK